MCMEALTLGTWKDKPILFTTGATNTEKLRIGNNGNIGIGTNDPTSFVDIAKVTASGIDVDMLNMRFDNNWGVKFQQSYTAVGNIQYNLIHRYNSTDYNSLTFKAC